MLKKEVTYKDFNDETVTDVLYFNLTKPELIELQFDYDGGLSAFMQRIIDAQDMRTLILQFKKILLLSYGEKTDDGKHFLKSEEMRERFYQSAAYARLFMELSTDDKAASDFLTGVIPKDLAEETLKNVEELKALDEPEKS